MALQSLVWKGEAVKARARQAQVQGIDRIMGRCVVEAKSNHPWQNRTGVLEGGIGIADYAAEDADGVRGTWGVQDVKYALMMELGGTIVPVKAKALAIPQKDGSVRFVSKVTIKPHPYLRPAGDTHYPSLPQAIRVAYDKLGGDAAGGADG